MTTKPFVLLISGPSCSGKSSLDAALRNRLPGTYLVAYDKLKWQMFGYERDTHREIIRQFVHGFFGVVCKSRVSVVLEEFMRSAEDCDRYRAIAAENGYRFISVALTAPTEVLVDRFRARLAEVEAKGGNMSVRDEALYRKNLAMPQYIPEDAVTFDTSVLSTGEILEAVLELIATTTPLREPEGSSEPRTADHSSL